MNGSKYREERPGIAAGATATGRKVGQRELEYVRGGKGFGVKEIEMG